MIRRLLVANRGEIARRVFATCRDLGIETVAVYSDADAGAPHVAEADLAVRLPGDAPTDTYLRADLIVAAARRAAADAVHPGYGFLSENAEFAAAVLDAGLVWVGPPPKAIALMGSKLEAKNLLADAGVPMLPSWTDPDQADSFPVLVKASAGGGGRGMRVVRERAALAEAVASASREAAAAFGDGTVFIERYVEPARHIEVQVFADTHGTVTTFGERECSIQRRHQKIVEEAPSPAVPAELRERLCAAATAAARAVGYVGAGTVEFLLAPTGEFFFLEMNTRLQVEHPVTECVYGVDLVRLQLLVAEGTPLPGTAVAETAALPAGLPPGRSGPAGMPPGRSGPAGMPPARGHAIEVRLYAEDPAEGWRPSTGTLHAFEVPGVRATFGALGGPGLRLDAGVEPGSVVGVHYDPMLAKLIAWAPTRDEAARLLADALTRARLHGVVTNRDLLVRVLRHPAFLAGETDTGFLGRHDTVFAPLADAATVRRAALAAALAGAAARRADAATLAGLPSGWRNVSSAPQSTTFDGPTGPVEVAYRLDRRGALAVATVGGEAVPASLISAAPDRVVLDDDGVRETFAVHRVGDVSYVDTLIGSVTLTEVPRFPLPGSSVAEGSLVAPMPGTVGRVAVAAGDHVHAGDLLLTLEAMKLEHPVYAPGDGLVAELPVAAGTQVDTGDVLAVITRE